MPVPEKHVQEMAQAVPIPERADVIAELATLVLQSHGPANLLLLCPVLARYWRDPVNFDWTPKD